MSAARRRLLACAGLAGVLLALAGIFGPRASESDLLDRLRRRAVAAPELGSGYTLRLSLERLGLFHPVPYAYPPPRHRVALSVHDLGRPPDAPTQRRYALDPVAPEDRASWLGVDPEWLRRPVTVASLLLAEEDLQELFAAPHARGDEWERPAYFTLLRDGEPVLSSYVGVRLHGGSSRTWREAGNFRIYFRKRYGLDRVPSELFPGRDAALPDRLILRHDGGETVGGHWRQFTNPLGLDVARQAGLVAPHARPAATFINGRFAGVKALTEWIHLDFLRTRFGHEDFTLVRTKGGVGMDTLRSVGDDRQFRELGRWLRRTRHPRLEDAAARIDLDNLVRWFLVVGFCATEDTFQGAMVRENTAEARWWWIPWDLDKSFGYPDRPGDWRSDTVATVLETDETRGTLLRRLLEGSPEFRRRVLELSAEVLNHRLTPEFLNPRVEAYAAYGELYRIERFDADALRRFVRHRPGRLRELLGEHLDAGQPRRLRLEGRPGGALEIDGHRVELPWEGWYYDGMVVELSSPGGRPLELRPAQGGPALRAARHRHRISGDAVLVAGDAS